MERLNGRAGRGIRWHAVCGVAAAMVLAFGGVARAVPTVQLTAVYRGSTTANTASSWTDFGPTTYLDLSSPDVQATPNLKAVFDVYLLYDGGVANGTDAFEGLTFNIGLYGAITGVSSNNVSNYPSLTSNKKWYANPSLEISLNGDIGGGAGDLQAVTILDNGSYLNPFAANFGTQADASGNFRPGWGSLIGHFAFAFENGSLTDPAGITFSAAAGSSFAWYRDPNNPRAYGYGTNSVTYRVIETAEPGGIIAAPEPAALGVLGLGVLCMVRRRRVAVHSYTRME